MLYKQVIQSLKDTSNSFSNTEDRTLPKSLNDLSKEEKESALKHHLIKVYSAYLNKVIDLDITIKKAIVNAIKSDKKFKMHLSLNHLSYTKEALDENLINLFTTKKAPKPQDFNKDSIEKSKALIYLLLA